MTPMEHKDILELIHQNLHIWFAPIRTCQQQATSQSQVCSVRTPTILMGRTKPNHQSHLLSPPTPMEEIILSQCNMERTTRTLSAIPWKNSAQPPRYHPSLKRQSSRLACNNTPKSTFITKSPTMELPNASLENVTHADSRTPTNAAKPSLLPVMHPDMPKYTLPKKWCGALLLDA